MDLSSTGLSSSHTTFSSSLLDGPSSATPTTSTYLLSLQHTGFVSYSPLHEMFLETWKEATGNLILTEGKALQQRHDVYQKPTLQFLIFPLYLSKTNIQLPVT